MGLSTYAGTRTGARGGKGILGWLCPHDFALEARSYGGLMESDQMDRNMVRNAQRLRSRGGFYLR